MPLKNVFDSNNDQSQAAFYFPTNRQKEAINDPSSSRSFYVSDSSRDIHNQQRDDNVEYSDYETETAPSFENFESEKIYKKPSDIKNLTLTHTFNSAESSSEPKMMKVRLNNTEPLHSYPAAPTLPISNTSNRNFNSNNFESTRNYSKFLFSSPSATVTSNGPSVITKNQLIVVVFKNS